MGLGRFSMVIFWHCKHSGTGTFAIGTFAIGTISATYSFWHRDIFYTRSQIVHIPKYVQAIHKDFDTIFLIVYLVDNYLVIISKAFV